MLVEDLVKLYSIMSLIGADSYVNDTVVNTDHEPGFEIA